MQASVMRIDDFISDKRTLVIPVYQRNYDWKEANCEKLFDDMTEAVKRNRPHFIGTFVYQHKPAAGIFQEFIIIDGQQRITSTILFARALCESTDDDALKDDIRASFIKHSKGDMRNKCKLRPTEYDRVVFEKLMSDMPFDETNFTDDEKSSAMYRNFAFFRKKISASDLSAQKLYDSIYQLNVVSILLQDENPQEIFESLNSTGLDLTQADLIRNFLLMPLAYERQTELYKNYWLKVEELLRPSDNVENFIVQYLITKRKSDAVMETKKQRLSKRNLYETFKDYFAENFGDNNVEDFLRELLRYAKFFRRCIFDADDDFGKLSALDKKFYELTFLLDSTNAPIILMYLLERYEQNHFDEATFIKFVDAMISLVFRAKVCRYTGITTQFAGNVLARLDKSPLTVEEFWKAITFGKGTYAFPRDKDFQEALANEKLFTTIKNSGCKYLLYSLERRARPKELPSYAEALIQIEHILPQTLNADWKFYLSARDDLSAHEIFLHTLGNLTLTGENSALGNSDFDAKKEIYSCSNFSYTRSLVDCPEWTSKQIQERAKRLATVALKIWTLPDEFNKRFNLDSDFGALTGKNPATLSIAGNEIKMPYWNHMLREIVRQLYALDKDTFRRAAKQDNVPKRLFTATPTEHKLDDGFYMTGGFEAKICLKFAKVLTENFDALGGTNFKSEIWFTLRAE